MIGKEYLNRLNQIMGESYPSSVGWMDLKTGFDFLYEAAKDFARKTKCLRKTQSITTVASQANYAVNYDFIEVYSENDDGEKVVKYYDTANYSWPTQQTYSTHLTNNNTTAVSVPDHFSFTNRAEPARVTGSATSNGTHSAGESTLTDSAASFTNVVSVGDMLYNTTASLIGVVLAVTDGTHLKTALFDASGQNAAYASWTSADAYILQPQSRYDLYLDPPPSTENHTVTLPYVAYPPPVYSDYGHYSFPGGFEEAILRYAVFLYRYRDSKPEYADRLFKYYDAAVREAMNAGEKAISRPKLSVSWKAV